MKKLENTEVGWARIHVLKSSIPATKLVNEKAGSKEFFTTGADLYVSDGFKDRILNKAKKTPGAFSLEAFDIVKNADDNLIELALPKEHIFCESDVCALIETLLKTQPKGKKGLLLNTGSWNLFYTPSCVVSVCRVGDEWGVHAWGRGGSEWVAGRRVFSPAIDR